MLVTLALGFLVGAVAGVLYGRFARSHAYAWDLYARFRGTVAPAEIARRKLGIQRAARADHHAV